MSAERWYLVAYDIADNKRLARLHRLMKKEGLAAQRSIFFVRATPAAVNRLMGRMIPIIKTTEDDVRAYPVTCPGEVWTSGENPLAAYPLLHVKEDGRSSAGPRNSLWQRMAAFFQKPATLENGDGDV